MTLPARAFRPAMAVRLGGIPIPAREGAAGGAVNRGGAARRHTRARRGAGGLAIGGVDLQRRTEALLNRRSTTWRELPEAEKAGLDAAAAARLLERHPTLIKRPVIEAGDVLIVGLAPPQQAALKSLVRA